MKTAARREKLAVEATRLMNEVYTPIIRPLLETKHHPFERFTFPEYTLASYYDFTLNSSGNQNKIKVIKKLAKEYSIEI